MARRLTSCLLLFLLLLASCGGSRSGSTARELAKSLESYPDYSVILTDMKDEGMFLTRYYHKYKLVFGDAKQETLSEEQTDWVEVKKKDYRLHADDLGMILVSRKEGGELVDVPQPAGYQYVGDEKYGRWKDDGRGGSFWEFYGKWMFMSTMFDMAFGPRIYRRDYGQYRNSVFSSRRPWYGAKGEYGTRGTVTQKSRPDFYKRSSSSFRDRVSGKMGRNAKTGRSRSSMRSRSGGFGK